MSNLCAGSKTVRRSFGKIRDIVPVPNLIEIQSKSFNDFVQLDYLPEERKKIGLEKVFRDIFSIEHGNKMSLEFVSYELGNWSCTCGMLTGIKNRYTWSCSSCNSTGCSRLSNELDCPSCKKNSASYKTCPSCLSRVRVKLPMSSNECRSSGQTLSMPLRATIQLISWDSTQEDKKIVRDIKEQVIFFSDIPIMVDLYEENGRFMLGSHGTFLINGVDRVIVSQLHRSPGVVFSQSRRARGAHETPFYLARIIPSRGSWFDFEFDNNDLLNVRVDKKKKFFVTTLLQALGFDRKEIIPYFYESDELISEKGKIYRNVDEKVIGVRLKPEMTKFPADCPYFGRPINKEIVSWLKKNGINKLFMDSDLLVNRVFASDVIDKSTGEVIAEQGEVFSKKYAEILKNFKKLELKLIVSSGYVLQPTIAMTLVQDKCMTEEDALKEIHVKVWPGDSASLREVRERLEAILFNPRLYDLTRVGRIRMNRKLSLDVDESITTLTKEDIFATVRYLVNLREKGEGELDDIDHLGNRRVRLVGELLSNQVYVGLLRIDRIVKERFRVQEMHGALMPQDFLNVKPLNAILREFFGTGQLSQFMDQTNPLSEIAHKRRLSALGPGGIMKDRATYEIRDVHTSHYGRICPIETPEGQTIGLISSLATYATVNDLGFIETAYHPVKDGKIKEGVVFLDAFEESGAYIAQADSLKSGKMSLEGEFVFARYEGNFIHADTKKVNYIDLSPKQLVSVATALIPFLEHDDASRALMGANMQRQAVPLIKTQVPVVGTGMELDVAEASGACIIAGRNGVVEFVSSERIILSHEEKSFPNMDEWIANGISIYHLRKFQRSSYSTWIHQIPSVKVGDVVKAGDMLTNSSSINEGELALGSNILVAFMPWHGYNYEDAIVLNKRLVAEDVFTSVHIDEYVAEARDTKLGPEEITRDIPNVSELALSGLDEDGIVRIGTRVAPGDILVGKVTLKGDVQFSPEEKLLRAIFGEKSREVRDTSLRVPPGVEGTIVDVKIFSRSGARKDERYKSIVERESEKLLSDLEKQNTLLEEMIKNKLISILSGKQAAPKASKSLLKGNAYDESKISKRSIGDLFALKTKDREINDRITFLRERLENQKRILSSIQEERIGRLKKGDPLLSGVIKMVKVYIASKRRIQVGDKIAGRHGNKGVVSLIVPREDMPYMEDGTEVDIVLNPLGVPSRMNVGQILETILGYSGTVLGKKIAESIEKGSYAEIKKQLEVCYGKKLIESYESDYGKNGIKDLAKKTSKTGVLYKTPVFDGADFEKDIKPILKEAHLPESGVFKLRDGRIGEFFHQSVTVGTIYMMKLNHMVDDKLHARSVGPYSLVTQQPLGGKAQMGGQRFGEMEVWALEAHGAAYALQEMLTYKSDDVSGRHKVYESIVRGERIAEPGLPESFNVLVKELQSLGLRIDLFKSSREEISG